MKKIFLVLILISSFQTFAQKDKSKNEIKISGEYTGVFNDLKSNKGTIELFLYQSNNGFSAGIILMKKSDLEIITGTIRVSGNGKFITGIFIPSEIKNIDWDSDTTKRLTPKDSYECGWNLYGEIQDNNGVLIKGKAVPNNCSESNLIEFTLNRKQ